MTEIDLSDNNGQSFKKSNVMKSMNKTQLIGYLGGDPIIKEFPSGNMLAILRMATHAKIKNPPSDTDDPYRTTWHNIKVWGRDRIDNIKNHFIKGSHVLVEGTIEYRTFIDKEGNTRYFTDITAFSLMNLDR